MTDPNFRDPKSSDGTGEVWNEQPGNGCQSQGKAESNTQCVVQLARGGSLGGVVRSHPPTHPPTTPERALAGAEAQRYSVFAQTASVLEEKPQC